MAEISAKDVPPKEQETPAKNTNVLMTTTTSQSKSASSGSRGTSPPKSTLKLKAAVDVTPINSSSNSRAPTPPPILRALNFSVAELTRLKKSMDKFKKKSKAWVELVHEIKTFFVAVLLFHVAILGGGLQFHGMKVTCPSAVGVSVAFTSIFMVGLGFAWWNIFKRLKCVYASGNERARQGGELEDEARGISSLEKKRNNNSVEGELHPLITSEEAMKQAEGIKSDDLPQRWRSDLSVLVLFSISALVHVSVWCFVFIANHCG